MSKDFWSLLFYLDKLFIALNATVSGELLWIYQENLEDILIYFVYISVGCFGNLEHELPLAWVVYSIGFYLDQF